MRALTQTLLAIVAMSLGDPLQPDEARAAPAISYGGGSCGKLEGGLALPCRGDNYQAFTRVACATGRTYLHPLVAETVRAAYAALAAAHPDRVWQYGDMGWQEGGPLWPHRTHQSGVSADFFFPVDDAAGRPAQVPISALHKYGYGLDFSADGRLGALQIDWRALADHLEALEREGAARGVRIRRVILAPALQRALLRQAPQARPLAARFNRRPAWVLHDEHYHVDFELPAPLRRPLRCP